MSEKVLELIDNGVFELEGASDYFFKFKKDYPTYDDIRKDYIDSTDTLNQLEEFIS